MGTVQKYLALGVSLGLLGCGDVLAIKPRAADWPARHVQSQPVPLTQVTVSGYLGKRIDRNLESIIAGTESPIIKNFEARVQGTAKAYRGNADSDISKWIEARPEQPIRPGDPTSRNRHVAKKNPFVPFPLTLYPIAT